MVGFAAVQIALLRGSHVITTAGDTFASRLRDLGAKVTTYGNGMVERVRDIAGGAPDLVLHTALSPGALPDLIKIVDGDASRVMSITDFDEGGLGVRTTGREPNLVSTVRCARSVRATRFGRPVHSARSTHLRHGGLACGA